MSEPTDVPGLSDAAREFVEGHVHTGEPSPEALVRVRARVVAQAATAPRAAEARKPSARRFLLSHELLAAAALILLLLGARAVVLALRSDAEPEGRGPQAQAVIDAYTAGDLEGAQRLASQHCAESSCGALASALARAVGLAPRVETLSADELGELARLDATLADGHETALARAIAQRRSALSAKDNAPPAETASAGEAAQLLEAAQRQVQERRYEAAVATLKRCVRAAPGFAPCYRVLGSTWARLATRDMDAKAMNEARVAYERYLELAPPDDEYVPKVREILSTADRPATTPAAPSPAELETFLVTAERARAQGQWLLVGQVARQILGRDPSNARARDLLAEVRREAMDRYLVGYQLKDTNPAEARRAFQQVLELLPADDDYAQKARARLDELGSK